jgi:type III restriction enzyme
MRIAMKMATGSGKTTVMSMLIGWQTVNAVRSPTSNLFSRGFLVITPGITIRDRLRVLLPNDPENYYRTRELLPADMLGDIAKAKIVITNFHAFKRRETMDLSKVGRALLQGRSEAPETIETEGQMLQRACGELMALKNVVVINDEAHHCYRAKPQTNEEAELKGDDKDEAKKNNEAARLWISGIEVLKRKTSVRAVYDLSATPFFLRGSGYAEGTLFPWTVSDFSLMDAIECGIVKLPRVPVADNLPGRDMPIYRELWAHIGKEMPKKGRGKSGELDPLKLPNELQTALYALYGHYDKTYAEWKKASIDVPPVFIVVCNNTSTSQLVYEWISGWERARDGDDERHLIHKGHLELFRNYDEYGERLARPKTLLIDSEQLESGDALDSNFREIAAPEIDQFKRELVERTRDATAADKLSDQDLLREVMNTVGKPGPPGRKHLLRRFGVDAVGRLGRQHCHPHSWRPRLRHSASMRAGGRARPAPTNIRIERRRIVRSGICRHSRHTVRFHRQACRGAAEAAEGDGTRPGREGARRARNHLSARRRLPGRTARGTHRRQV